MQVLHIWLDLQHCRRVAAPVHVVGGGEECEGLPVVMPEEAVLHHLVSPDQEFQAIAHVPLLEGVLAKQVSRASRALHPTLELVLRVTPGDVCQHPRVPELLDSLLTLDVVNTGGRGGDTTVTTE